MNNAIRSEMRNRLKIDVFCATMLMGLLACSTSFAQQQIPQRGASGLFGLDGQVGNVKKKILIPHSTDQGIPDVNDQNPIIVRQMTPVSGITFPCTPVIPSPISCDAYKGSPSDLTTLRQTVSGLWELRGKSKSELESKAPKNCAGKEWTYYMKVLAALGDGSV